MKQDMRLSDRLKYVLRSDPLIDEAIALEQELDALQAKLDAVMLEYCPDEMTQEQTEKWASSQVVSNNSEFDAARLEVERLYTAIKKITKLNAIDAGIYTTGKIDAICKEALAAQQE